ncbi:hypothetical protein CXR29_05195 [Brevibacterium linens]|nr:hypothetical protein CXR29_05195 [Brevibacterium linens]
MSVTGCRAAGHTTADDHTVADVAVGRWDVSRIRMELTRDKVGVLDGQGVASPRRPPMWGGPWKKIHD